MGRTVRRKPDETCHLCKVGGKVGSVRWHRLRVKTSSSDNSSGQTHCKVGTQSYGSSLIWTAGLPSQRDVHAHPTCIRVGCVLLQGASLRKSRKIVPVLKLNSTIAVVLLGLFAVVALHPTPTAQAAAVSCRRDPIVWMSDGTKVQMVVTIASNIADVQNILYTVHTPSGVVPTKIVYPGGKKASIEQVKFVQDQTPHNYSLDVLVTTTTSGILVTVDAKRESQKFSQSGISGKPIGVALPLK